MDTTAAILSRLNLEAARAVVVAVEADAAAASGIGCPLLGGDEVAEAYADYQAHLAARGYAHLLLALEAAEDEFLAAGGPYVVLKVEDRRELLAAALDLVA